MGALHAWVITEHQDTVLALVVDPDRAVGEPLAERFRTEWVPELDDPAAYDVFIIATPTPFHTEWAHRILESGKPMLVEKPISTDLARTEHLVAEARRLGVPMTCGLLERFNAAVVTALNIVENPVHVTALRHSPYAPRIPTGVMFDLLIHDVDLVTRLTGRHPDQLTAHLSYVHPLSLPGAEDIAEVTMQYDTGELAVLSASRISQRKQRMIHINELDRLVEIDLVRQDVTVYHHVGNTSLDGGPGYRQQTIIDIPTIQNPREPLVAQLDHFVALCWGSIDAEAELDTIILPHQVVDEAFHLAAGHLDPAPSF